ncbi:ferric reductase NAD binding domain-containing protein [Lasiosphaeria hispida]|uniref:Ferric reductase NAD binding domain-containing protein n=1 Tax=Lasiosphaeria hispida TaxID=260671 RepID=A0AAJ0HBW0_9PEZI|nr:ferric reductase NAD binding domain-containing protein [Lasiosphaeria hispida]
MGWPYHFVVLSEAEKLVRREALDRYAIYAQLSALLPIAVALLYRIATSGRQDSYSAIPSSPTLKSQRSSSAGGWALRTQKLQWWLGEDFVPGGKLGQRDQWIIGVFWAFWMVSLSVLGTGDDYLHLTKRFGMVAASQYPIQYLLALKSLNPYAFAFRSSHEHINRYHRVLGRVITLLLVLHWAFYMNFFAQNGLLPKRMSDPIVRAGVVSFLSLNILNTTALRPMRKLSYRLFFIVHLVVAFVMPVLLSFHAKPARIFMAEALVVFVADLASRKFDTVTAHASLESIPGTNLVKITASVPHPKINRFRTQPGSHIYLSIPAGARKSVDAASVSHLLFGFLFNPFTVAAVDEENGNLTLVARHRSGPMTAALARLAGGTKLLGAAPASASSTNTPGEKIPLYIEGPYGVATRFPHLSTSGFDRVLLVAGGIGATFIVPLYRSIIHENPSARVQMVWAVRGAGDATWAVTSRDEVQEAGILNDENVEIFLTRDVAAEGSDTGSASGSRNGECEVEMSSLQRDRRRNKFTAQHNRKRPDLKKIVDDVFKHGSEERVAVLVCGPAEMARELRAHVGVWVGKGRSVWWHNEGFGF